MKGEAQNDRLAHRQQKGQSIWLVVMMRAKVQCKEGCMTGRRTIAGKKQNLKSYDAWKATHA